MIRSPFGNLNNTEQRNIMKKVIWTTLGLFAFAGFAFAGDCKKCKKDGETAKEETVIAGKCKKECKDGEAKEETIAGKCKKECKDGEAKEETVLA